MKNHLHFIGVLCLIVVMASNSGAEERRAAATNAGQTIDIASSLLQKTGSAVSTTPVTSAALLWDNTNINVTTSGIVSNDLRGRHPDSSLVNTADDFVVPAGVQWSVDSIYARGFSTVVGAVDSFAVAIHQNDGTNKPGTRIYYRALIPANGLPRFDSLQLKLPAPVVLTSGTYWLSIYAIYNTGTVLSQTRWNWYNGPTAIGLTSHIQDFTGLFGIPPFPWTPVTSLGVPNPSNHFALFGQSAGGPPVNVINESFEGTTFPPTGWIKLSPDGGTGWNRQVNGTTPVPGWQGGVITVPPGGGNAVAFCTWNTGGSTSNNQFLVTPQITNVQATDSLKFWLRWWPNNFADTVDVLISTSTPTVPNFTTVVAVLGFPAGSTVDTGWIQRGYRLSDHVSVGSNIYIAFRERVANNVNDGASISLDLVRVTGTGTGTPELISNLPADYRVEQNYPNPFNPSTTIRFSIPVAADVSLKVYNALGQEVASLAGGEYQAGTYSLQWDATGLASGIYFYRMQAGNFSQTRKLVLMK